jgi:tRNA (cmo5U34)-methyltransferase
MHDSFEPESYLSEVRGEIPSYDDLQAVALTATASVRARRILELGVGTGETTRRLLASHPGAELVGIDRDPAMLEHAARLCRGAPLQIGRLQDALPSGPFDLAISVLAVHHLHALEKASLFERVRRVLAPDGRFVLADLIVPEDPKDVVTEVDGTVVWRLFDLAVFVADR